MVTYVNGRVTVFSPVMAGLVPAISTVMARPATGIEFAGTSPAMTN
jgi:hypothetical protein